MVDTQLNEAMEHRGRKRGIQEIPHTADWAMRVWAEDLPSLFEEAAAGMNVLSGAIIAESPRVIRAYEQRAADSESLLVGFLSELVYLLEHENLGFTDFRVKIDESSLFVEMHGGSLISVAKPIKAVTYHDMKISRIEAGFEVSVVFDV